jgi:hypothetical protein
MKGITFAILFLALTYMLVKSETPKDSKEAEAADLFAWVWLIAGFFAVVFGLFGK